MSNKDEKMVYEAAYECFIWSEFRDRIMKIFYAHPNQVSKVKISEYLEKIYQEKTFLKNIEPEQYGCILRTLISAERNEDIRKDVVHTIDNGMVAERDRVMAACPGRLDSERNIVILSCHMRLRFSRIMTYFFSIKKESDRVSIGNNLKRVMTMDYNDELTFSRKEVKRKLLLYENQSDFYTDTIVFFDHVNRNIDVVFECYSPGFEKAGINSRMAIDPKYSELAMPFIRKSESAGCVMPLSVYGEKKEKKQEEKINNLSFKKKDLIETVPITSNNDEGGFIKNRIRDLDNDPKAATVGSLFEHSIYSILPYIQYSTGCDLLTLICNSNISQKEEIEIINYAFIIFESRYDKQEPETIEEQKLIIDLIVNYWIYWALGVERKGLMDKWCSTKDIKQRNTDKKKVASVTEENKRLIDANKAVRKENEKLKEEISLSNKDLKLEIKRLQKELSKEKKETKAAKKECREKDEKIDSLNSYIDSINDMSDGNGDSKDKYTEEKFREIIAEKKVLVWGLRGYVEENLKEKYPDLKFCSSSDSVRPTRTMFEKYDAVVMRTDYTSHSSWYRAVDVVRKTGVPVRYLLKGETNDMYLWKAVIDMLSD